MAMLTDLFEAAWFSIRNSSLRQRRSRIRRGARLRWQPIVAAEVLEERTLLSTLTVTTLADVVDDGDEVLSLREAILIANDNSGATSFDGISSTDAADTIQFDASLAGGTINLVGLLPTLSSDITITGLGADQLTINSQGNAAGDNGRVFEVASGTVAEISGLTLKGGQISFGGAILNAGTLTVTASRFSDNLASLGGGIFNTGTLTVADSTFSDNRANDGGAIWNDGTLTVSGTTLSGNVAIGSGGGIFNTGAVTVIDSVIGQNQANPNSNSGVSGGGGIRNVGANATLTVIDSTLSDNFAGGNNGGGGGLFNSASATLINTTVSGNSGTTINTGGGIRNTGTLELIDSTFSNNTALNGGGVWNTGTLTVTGSSFNGNAVSFFGDQGGGIWNAGTLTVTASIFSGNSAGMGGGIYNSNSGTLTVSDSTLSGNSAGSGAGIRNTGMLTVSDSTFSGNSASSGSGISSFGELTVSNSTFRDNTANSAGGGINNLGIGTVSESTFIDNQAGGGGGIRNSGTLTVADSFFSGNSASTGGALFNAGTLTVGDSTVRDNAASGSGGGIFNTAGALTVNNTVFSGNSAGAGGAIRNDGTNATLTLTGSTLSGNTANVAGALQNITGTATLIESTLDGNSASTAGGVENTGTLTVIDSTLSGNAASPGGAGGGISNVGANAVLIVTGSTLSGNFANVGGGIRNLFGTVTVTNSTLSGNSSSGFAGGIWNNGALTVISSTIVLNRANSEGNTIGTGGGIQTASGGSTTLRNTIVAGNVRGAEGSDVPDDLSGESLDSDSTHNLIGDAGSSGGLMDGGNGNIVGNGGVGVMDITTVLDTTLADNGGPTLTHALVVDSPALNAGSNALAVDADGNPLATDQRGNGFDRIFDGIVDIGAFELQNARPEPGDFAKVGAEDNTLIFSAADFTAHFSDSDGDSLVAVRIESLPEGGTLELNGEAVSIGQVITADDLDALVFVPNLNFNGVTSFTYTASDGIAGFAVAPASVTLNIRSAFEQAADLQAQVDALVLDGVLSKGQGNSLKSKLNLNGKPKRDAAKIGEFIDQVNAFVESGTLTQDQADVLLSAAETLLISITTE